MIMKQENISEVGKENDTYKKSIQLTVNHWKLHWAKLDLGFLVMSYQYTCFGNTDTFDIHFD